MARLLASSKAILSSRFASTFRLKTVTFSSIPSRSGVRSGREAAGRQGEILIANDLNNDNEGLDGNNKKIAKRNDMDSILGNKDGGPFLGGNLGARCFSSRVAERSESWDGRASAGRQGKSLIEDEAELSDWVSDLKTDSFRLGHNSDSEDSDGAKKKSVKRNNGDGRDRVRDSGGFSDKRRSRSDVGFSERSSRGSLSSRHFDSDLENEERSRVSSGFRKGQRTSGFSERNSRGSLSKRWFDSDLGEEEEVEGSRGSNGFRKSRGPGGFSETKQRGPLSKSKRRVDSDSEDEGEDEEHEEFLSRQRKGSGLSLSFNKRGGRNVESTYKQGRKESLHETSEEEEDDGDDVYGFDDDFFGGKAGRKKDGMKDSLLKSVSLDDLGNEDNEVPVPRSSGGDRNSYLSNTRFDQCSISSLTLKGVKAAGYERLTLVQEATLPIILKGKDVLAKAKTGTGKTVAFLLPAIEIVSKLPPVDRDQKKPPINVLVICPTRELADQAATEANMLLKFHPSIGVQVVMGGTRLALEQKRMQENPCQILVATPGRLRDHIENTAGFATRLMGVKVLVLDEADRLLDMGFRKDIEKIVAAVPKQRQTLLFSATVPDEVRQICYIALKRDHEFVNTVGEGTEETHSQVKQMHLIAPLEKQFPVLYSLLTDHIAEDVDYKVIVFCTTAMVTRLVADLLSELRLNVREIHSRKPQSYRTRVSKEFKESKGLILVSSDVSARGVDYPDVTLVIQVGVPADREQYIHRLGRTGRQGKEGKGILLLAPWEEFFLSSIKDLPMTNAPNPLVDPDTTKKVARALGHVEPKNKESAYQAWLGYYSSNKVVGRDKYKLVLLANEFSRAMELDNPPAVPKLVLRKMGLNNVPGLRAK